MIVSMLRTMHPQSSPLTIDGNVLKESDDLVILGVTFDSKMTFEKHLRSVYKAASQRLSVLRKSGRVFHDRSLIGRCFRGLVLPVPVLMSLIPAADDNNLELPVYRSLDRMYSCNITLLCSLCNCVWFSNKRLNLKSINLAYTRSVMTLSSIK